MPKIDRPRNYDLKIDHYLKINLTERQYDFVHLSTKKIKSNFLENDLCFNLPELLKTFVLNLDDDELIQVLTRLYQNDSQSIFGGNNGKI